MHINTVLPPQIKKQLENIDTDKFIKAARNGKFISQVVKTVGQNVVQNLISRDSDNTASAMNVPEQALMIKQMARLFSENYIRPAAAHYDKVEEMPWDVMESALQMGISQSVVVEADEGDIAGAATAAKAVDKDKPKKISIKNQVLACGAEELSWGCAGIALALNASGLAATPVSKMGTPEQKKLFTDALKGKDENGHIKVAAMAMSEPTTGSDISDIRTIAEKVGDHYIINGSKQWITNGKSGSVFIVWALTDKKVGRSSMRGFVIPRGTDGLIPGEKEVKLGIRASETAAVHLENCKVPVEWMLGGDQNAKQGIKGAHAMFDSTRPLVGAQAVGIAQATYEYMVEYGRQESLRGKKLCEHQWFAFEIAEMAMEIEASRTLVQKSVWMADNQVPNANVAAMAKAHAARTAQESTTRAIRLLGNEGWSDLHPVEKWYRDAKIYDIFEGTGQIQRRIIGKSIFGANAK